MFLRGGLFIFIFYITVHNTDQNTINSTRLMRPAMYNNTEYWALDKKLNKVCISVIEMIKLRWIRGVTISNQIKNE